MPSFTKARRFFSLLSSASLAAGLVTLAPSAMAACPEPDPGQLPYVGARAPSNVCTPADHKAIYDKIQSGTATFADIETAVKTQNAACATCIFSKEEDSAWAPFVYVGDEGAAFINWGSCFEKGAGGSKACGQAVTQTDLCIGLRCVEDTGYCTSATAYDTCVETVAQDATSCGGYGIGAACPNYDTQYDTTCKDLFAVIGVMCGGSLPAAQPDAGTPTTDGGTGTNPPKPPKADAGSGGKKDAGASTGDEDEDEDEAPPPPSTGGSKKKDAGTNNAEDTAVTDTSSGCAQSGSSPTGSVATALVAMVAIGGAMRSRRRNKR